LLKKYLQINYIIISCNRINLKNFKTYEIKNNSFIIRKLKVINEINWSINKKSLETTK